MTNNDALNSMSRVAENKNAENLVVLDSPEIALRYRDNWAHRYTVSKPVQQ